MMLTSKTNNQRCVSDTSLSPLRLLSNIGELPRTTILSQSEFIPNVLSIHTPYAEDDYLAGVPTTSRRNWNTERKEQHNNNNKDLARVLNQSSEGDDANNNNKELKQC